MDFSEIELTDEELLEVFKSKFEFVLILSDKKIETNEEKEYEKYMEADDIRYAFCLSDFETYYEIRDYLKEKGLV